MISKIEAELRVTRGAAYLDELRPGWYNKINVETLTIHDCRECVVGQLTGHWRPSALALDHRSTTEYGFNLCEPDFAEFTKNGGTMSQWYQPLQDAWITAIVARKSKELSDIEQDELVVCY